MTSSFVGKRLPRADTSAVWPSRATTVRTNALLKQKTPAKKAPKKPETPAGLSFLPGFKLGDAKPKQTLKLKGSKAVKKAAAAAPEAPFGLQLPGIRIDDIPQPGNIDPIIFALGLSGVTVFLIAGLLITS